jgi:hypothetical protein
MTLAWWARSMKGRVDEIRCLSVRVLLQSVHMPMRGHEPTLLQNAVEPRRRDSSSEPQSRRFTWPNLLEACIRCASLDAAPQATERDLAQTLSASGMLNLHQDWLHTLARRACSEVPMCSSAKSDRSPFATILALLAPRRLAYVERAHALHSPTHYAKKTSSSLPLCTLRRFGLSIIHRQHLWAHL